MLNFSCYYFDTFTHNCVCFRNSIEVSYFCHTVLISAENSFESIGAHLAHLYLPFILTQMFLKSDLHYMAQVDFMVFEWFKTHFNLIPKLPRRFELFFYISVYGKQIKEAKTQFNFDSVENEHHVWILRFKGIRIQYYMVRENI